MKSKNTTATVNKNDFYTAESAKQISEVVKSAQLTQLYETAFTYSISDADNRVVKGKNRISVLNEEQSRAERIIKTLKLDTVHDATSRIEVWVDKTQIVVYVGATFNVTARLSKKQNTEQFTELAELHAKSRDTKWRYAQSCETRHKFDSIETFTRFYNLLSDCIASQLKAEAEAEQSKAETQNAEQNAEQSKAEEQSTKQKQKSTKQKQKQTTKQKSKAE